MKNTFTLLFICLISISSLSAQNIGEMSLTDAVTGKTYTIASEIKGKALVLIFHSTNCPFAKMYEKRIIDLRTKFQNQGISFALVNPDPKSENQNADNMRSHVDATDLNMSYLMDVDQTLVKAFNITKIPEVVIITPNAGSPSIVYRGAIDNNAQVENSVTERYVERAINQVLKGEKPSPEQVRAVGCNVRSF
ncbi:redoxin domain-containing protein [Algoriphagus aestuarii]|nr:redoxin domain-containing protein [Algoriphagus aestuarii]